MTPALEAMWVLTWRDLLRFARDRSQVAGAVARPLLWLLLMGQGLRSALPMVRGVDYQHFVFAGAIAMAVLFSGMFQSITIIWDREFGFLKEVLVAPVPRAAIVLGKVLAGAAVTLLQGLVTVAFAPVVGVHVGPLTGLLLLGEIALLALSITGLGVALASRMRSFEGFGLISNFVVMPLYFLSGGVFPIDRLPLWMTALVRVNPVTYAVDLMRATLHQPSSFRPGVDLAVLGGFACATVGLALALFRREA